MLTAAHKMATKTYVEACSGVTVCEKPDRRPINQRPVPQSSAFQSLICLTSPLSLVSHFNSYNYLVKSVEALDTVDVL